MFPLYLGRCILHSLQEDLHFFRVHFRLHAVTEIRHVPPWLEVPHL